MVGFILGIVSTAFSVLMVACALCVVCAAMGIAASGM